MPVRPSSRTIAERNEARRCLDSTNSIRRFGFTILIGIPGSPAPDPISTRLSAVSGTTCRKRRLSRNNSSAIHVGSDVPIIRWTEFHLINRSRYLLNSQRSVGVSCLRRISYAPLASRSRAAVLASGEGRLGPRGVLRLARRTAGACPVHIPLLQDLEDVRYRPVQDQPRRAIEEHEGEHEGHDEHHLSLARIAHRRRHLLLEKHRHAHEDREDIRRVVTREVTDPDVDAKDAPKAQER